MIVRVAVMLLIAAWLFTPGTAVAQPFVSPIGGTPYVDWTIVNYVDLDSGGGVLDYAGGTYTYNGHNAIDFTLPNFAVMDAGVDVYAAAAGTVTFARDGEFDRCSRVNACGNNPDYVVIDHGGGVVTEYFHLKKDSILVGMNDVVTAGQMIAQVGSSGLSTDAHLHFAVYENGTAIETYLDPGRWWVNPLPYAGTVPGFLDHGITNHAPSDAEFVERPVDQDVFLQSGGAGQRAYLWSQLHGVANGDTLGFTFKRADGSTFAQFPTSAPQISYGWWYAFVNLPTVPELGIWSIDLTRNGMPFLSDSFIVTATPGDYNNDDAVSAADYVIWRNNDLSQAAYDAWRQSYLAAGGSLQVSLPEPHGVTLLATCGLLFAGIRGRRISWRFPSAA